MIIFLSILIPALSFFAGYYLKGAVETYKWKNIQKKYKIIFINAEDEEAVEYMYDAVEQYYFDNVDLGDYIEPIRNKKDKHLKVVREDKKDGDNKSN